MTEDVSDRDGSNGLVVSLVVDDENAVNAGGSQNSDGTSEGVLREDSDGGDADIDGLLANSSEELEDRGGEGREGGVVEEETQVLSGGDSNEFTVISSDGNTRKSLRIHQAEGINDASGLGDGLDGLGTKRRCFNGDGGQLLERLEMLIQVGHDRRLRDNVDELSLVGQDGNAMQAAGEQLNDIVERGGHIQWRKFVSSREVRDSDSFSCGGLKHVHSVEDDVLQSVIVDYLLLIVHKANERNQITHVQKSDVRLSGNVVDRGRLDLVRDDRLKTEAKEVTVSIGARTSRYKFRSYTVCGSNLLLVRKSSSVSSYSVQSVAQRCDDALKQERASVGYAPQIRRSAGTCCQLQ